MSKGIGDKFRKLYKIFVAEAARQAAETPITT